MVDRVIGGVVYPTHEFRNEVGFDNLSVCTVPEASIPTLGPPQYADTFVQSDNPATRGFLTWDWNNSVWIPLQYRLGIDNGAIGATGPAGPAGPTGPQGVAGTNGTNGVGASPGNAAPMTIAFATAYQAPDATKSAFISIMIETAYSTSVAGTQTDEVEVRIGADNAVATGGGVRVGTVKTSLTGIAVTVGMGTTDRSQVAVMLPPGWFFSVRRLSGTIATINATFIQSLS